MHGDSSPQAWILEETGTGFSVQCSGEGMVLCIPVAYRERLSECEVEESE